VILKIDAGGSLHPTSFKTVEENRHNIVQDGKTVLNTQ
jgi:3-oxoacyl-[acyl-carrier-protein] synthase-3